LLTGKILYENTGAAAFSTKKARAREIKYVDRITEFAWLFYE
jgi:hypothetical protein